MGQKQTLEGRNYKRDGFNRVGGLSGNQGKDRKVKKLRTDSQITGLKWIEGWVKEELQEGEGKNPRRWALLYYLSSVTRKFPLCTESWSAVIWVILPPWGLKTTAVPPTTPSDCCRGPYPTAQDTSSGDFNSHTPKKIRAFFCVSFAVFAFSAIPRNKPKLWDLQACSI